MTNMSANCWFNIIDFFPPPILPLDPPGRSIASQINVFCGSIGLSNSCDSFRTRSHHTTIVFPICIRYLQHSPAYPHILWGGKLFTQSGICNYMVTEYLECCSRRKSSTGLWCCWFLCRFMRFKLYVFGFLMRIRAIFIHSLFNDCLFKYYCNGTLRMDGEYLHYFIPVFVDCGNINFVSHFNHSLPNNAVGILLL